MVEIKLIESSEFERVERAVPDIYARLEILADMFRANTLAVVKRAGSGHLGSSFSAMDIVVWLYYRWMNVREVGYQNPDRDIYFSSKGHDVPGLYSVLYALGILPETRFINLRRLGGVDGHPDVRVPGIEANSGSLGMGLSKGRGMAWAKRHLGRAGRVFVMTGDGELQEGQNYEALTAAVNQRITNLTMIVDNNKVQSDMEVCRISDLGDLETKLRAFGWHVARCDGHDFRQLEAVLKAFERVQDRPKALIADTVKGRGVSFMEHPQALQDGKGYYRWHSGAPPDEFFLRGHAELVDRANARLAGIGLAPLVLKTLAPPVVKQQVPLNALGEPISGAGLANARSGVTDEYVANAFGRTLVALAADWPNLVVLDADLASDCRTREFELTYPGRFIENGIAEQDMVSMAGGLARMGILPVVNSFASFLAARANEQIYNNICEKDKVIYVCHYAGMIPAGPGKSHQSVRDIGLLGALNCPILQPCNAAETEMILRYAVVEAPGSCVIRLIIGPSPRAITLPTEYKLREGCGAVLRPGRDAVLFAYGPVMLHEALLASEILAHQGFDLMVVNMPWLNRCDPDWLRSVSKGMHDVFVAEDHCVVGGLGDRLREALGGLEPVVAPRLHVLGLKALPECGTPAEVLAFHALDGQSLARRIQQTQGVP